MRGKPTGSAASSVSQVGISARTPARDFVTGRGLA